MSNPKMSAKELFERYDVDSFLLDSKFEGRNEMISEVASVISKAFRSTSDRYDTNEVYNMIFSILDLMYDERMGDLSKIYRLQHDPDNDKFIFESTD